MPARPAESHHCSRVEEFLHDKGFEHLRARKYGATVIVESGPEGDAIRHFRVRRDTAHLWLLDMADHRGKWQRTPVRALLDEVLDQVVESFPWVLADQG